MFTRHLLVAFAISAGTALLGAQDVRQQANAITTPAYTDQQRWSRQNSELVVFITGTIAHAKAHNQTIDELGSYFVDLFASSWGPKGSGVPVRVARGFVLNQAAMPNADASILAASDSSATMRFRRAYVSQFGPSGEMNGVTVADYERFFTVLNERLAAYLGLGYSQRIDGEWMTLTFSGQGSNALVSFPRDARYTATVTGEQAGDPALAGTYDLQFTPGGEFELTLQGQSKVRGRYDVQLDQLSLHDETGAFACPGTASGTYRFTPQTNGDLTLGRLSDLCEGRAQFVGRRWTKK